MDYADRRLDICRHCDHFNNIVKTCGLCHCFMPAKTLIKSAVCPDAPPRWLALNDPENNPDCHSCNHKD